VNGGIAVPVGVGLFVVAYLNWRYIEAVTRSSFGGRAAKRLADSWFGNKIGGTIFLCLAGSITLIGGFVQILR
jgi:hypothetical protein